MASEPKARVVIFYNPLRFGGIFWPLLEGSSGPFAREEGGPVSVGYRILPLMKSNQRLLV